MRNITVKIEPLKIEIIACSGDNLLELLRKRGLYLSSSCGGHGICGKCLVRVKTTESPTFQFKYACQVIVNDDIIVDLSQSSFSSSNLTKSNLIRKYYNLSGNYTLKPDIRRKFVEISSTYPCDYLSQLSQVCGDIKQHKTTLNFLKKVSHSIGNLENSGWVIYDSDQLVDWIPSNQPTNLFGCAVDVGTTNIAVEIVDLETGNTHFQGVDINSQVKFGDDVISRISYASMSPKNLQELQDSVISTINDLIDKGLKEIGAPPKTIYKLVFAGNTTMIHLLLGVCPKPLGELPFSPVFTAPVILESSELGLTANPSAQVYTMPAIGSFVGGDITAGLIALDLFDTEKNFLFLDLGTNGEIVIGKRGNIVATSTATGPAFEGSRIACGMRADEGAIDHVFISDQDLSFTVIGNSSPRGICGSAIIELISILLDLKTLDSTGRFLIGSMPNNVPPGISSRIVINNGEPQVVIYSDTSSNTNVYLSARDIRQFQLACGAIRCGVNLLLSHIGLFPEEIDEVYIAGNFGNYVNPKYLLKVGILPSNISQDKIITVGNTSLLGAKIALLDIGKRNKAEKLVKSVKHIELATLPNFEEEFILSMCFPES